MSHVPTTIQRSGIAIEITWSDGNRHSYLPSSLRKACPCAICREKKTADQNAKSQIRALPVLSLAETKPLEVMKMEPVGNYAYNIHFSDGHGSGIFTFDLLRTLGES